MERTTLKKVCLSVRGRSGLNKPGGKGGGRRNRNGGLINSGKWKGGGVRMGENFRKPASTVCNELKWRGGAKGCKNKQ